MHFKILARDMKITVSVLAIFIFTNPSFGAAKSEQIIFSYRDKSDGVPQDSELYIIDTDGKNLKRLTNNQLREYNPTWSPDATKIAFTGTTKENPDHHDIFVMDANGKNCINLTGNHFNYFSSELSPTWSPDGTKIAFACEGDICVMDADGKNLKELTSPVLDNMPAWSPDGKSIAYLSRQNTWDANREIYIMNPDGTDRKKVTELPNHLTILDTKLAWSPDCQKIAFISHNLNKANNADDIFMIDVDGEHVTNLSQHEASYYSAAWSPNGRQIIFSGYFNGIAGIYIMDIISHSIQSLTDFADETTDVDWFWTSIFTVDSFELFRRTCWGAIKKMNQNTEIRSGVDALEKSIRKINYRRFGAE